MQKFSTKTNCLCSRSSSLVELEEPPSHGAPSNRAQLESTASCSDIERASSAARPHLLLLPTPVQSSTCFQTMPRDTHATGGGTKHHCPGAKISYYIKMGPCRADRWKTMCTTHQIHCPTPKCNWIHLNREPCTRCSKVRVSTRKIYIYCSVPKF